MSRHLDGEAGYGRLPFGFVHGPGFVEEERSDRYIETALKPVAVEPMYGRGPTSPEVDAFGRVQTL
jgi:hypothetical protein